MLPRVRLFFFLATASLGLSACVGTTGGDLFTFSAKASGPEDAEAEKALVFDNDLGYRVTLTRAIVRIGAVYLNRAMPVPGAQETSCILPGKYLAQVTRSLDVDVLSPTAQPFPGEGQALEERAIAGEIWLSDGDVNALESDTPVFSVAGTAERDGKSYPFEGRVTIGRNRLVPINDPAQPGSRPICRERIVSPIVLDLLPRKGGSLLVRIDPRKIFGNVDFDDLDKASDDPLLYRFKDQTSGQPNVNLYRGLKAQEGTYTFSWLEP